MVKKILLLVFLGLVINGFAERTETEKIIIDNDLNVISNVTVGSFTYANGVPQWELQVGNPRVLTNAQTVVCGYNTVIKSNSVTFNLSEYYVIPQVSGYYFVICIPDIRGTPTTTGRFMQYYIQKGEEIIYTKRIFSAVSSENSFREQIVGLVSVNGTTDYIKISVYNNFGAPLTNQPTEKFNFIGILINRDD